MKLSGYEKKEGMMAAKKVCAKCGGDQRGEGCVCIETPKQREARLAKRDQATERKRERERERWIESGGAGKPYEPLRPMTAKLSPIHTVEQKPAMTKVQARIVALKGCTDILAALSSDAERGIVLDAIGNLYGVGW